MKLDKYQKAMWCIGIFGGVFILFRINYNWPFTSGNLFDESVISFMAFAMLIITALMQNRDLRLQRKEMELQREQFEDSKIALQDQKNEMIQSNSLLIESNKQTQFYELLRLKEDLTMKLELNYYQINKRYYNKILKEIIKQYPNEKVTLLIEVYSKNISEYKKEKTYFNGNTMEKNKKEIKNDILKFEYLTELNRNSELYDILRLLFVKCYENIRQEMPIEYYKMSKYNKLINLLIENKNVKGSFQKSFETAMSPYNNMMSQLQKSMGLSYKKPELTLSYIYEGSIINEEGKFYELVDGELNYNSFITNKY